MGQRVVSKLFVILFSCVTKQKSFVIPDLVIEMASWPLETYGALVLPVPGIVRGRGEKVLLVRTWGRKKKRA